MTIRIGRIIELLLSLKESEHYLNFAILFLIFMIKINNSTSICLPSLVVFFKIYRFFNLDLDPLNLLKVYYLV